MAPTDTQGDAPTSARDQNGDRILAVINYALLLVGIGNGLTVLIAAILAYVRKDNADPLVKNHFQFQIRTFWYWLAMVVVGLLTWIFLIGMLILLIANIWLVIRSVVGMIRLVDGRPHSDPTGFWV
ncbi:MAG: hypothetical protein CMH90_07140 [Oceanicaulis sp.]|uniref:DUF4870 family protein n=1 Tax=Oceanicaulis sp. UBA2681 TaxID=1947007 RepID=UPI000C0A19B7|nr:DUF4870 domain-containing protein [Oceanicaulis sp. UBA2681]MAP49237.1 hypothetical protein [Oceanicaulis sp.]|tara:strand:+ start:1013 stop:1390 length:378 start_codon:yes stop_codon:yes gene_type:complete